VFLAENLNILLSIKKMKKADLARSLDVSPQQIGKYLKGDNQPKLEYLIEIARIFDVNLDDLILKDLTKESARPFGAAGEDRASEDETLDRMNQLLEQRVATLEREILRDNPGLASELGIE
jgi:transcriptional regulator with XRE-family HTH domain